MYLYISFSQKLYHNFCIPYINFHIIYIFLVSYILPPISCILYPVSCIRYTLSLEETFSPDIGPLTHWIVCTGNKGDLCFIFLLSVCNVLLPLECMVKFWHSACFILNFWDNFCNFLCKIKYGSIRLIKKAWSMVIIFIRKISTFYKFVTLVKVMKNENALVAESRMEFY